MPRRFRGALAPDPSVSEDKITTEYLARNVWLVGSPETVARKLREHYNQAGGWGTLIGFAFDCSEDPEPWRRSMELMATDVMDRVRDLDFQR
jgi:alkanesulfonate monooxygenase SsuD/methylene tetrahydromethanopterin reductase-like flavin-dependent oxidoreductase (luciferase family)